MFHVRPGKQGQFIGTLKKVYQPVLERLTSEGAILAWGLDATVFHRPGAPTFVAWFSCPKLPGVSGVYDYAGLTAGSR